MKSVPLYDALSLDEITTRLRNNGFGSEATFWCFVAEERQDSQHSMVGYVIFSRIYSTWVGRALCITDIFVIPEFRRKGIGSALLLQVIHESKRLGCCRIDCYPVKQNPALLSLLKKHKARDLNDGEGWSFYQLDSTRLRDFASDQSGNC
ncbi:thialysine N-epsilon-acetyltransferase-like [Ornithodoros turicata]|uniref:thialysine N-epsilon-acetyltransferase-like n=1 Tax=Ornithodoros turicata TaxID=34597 RepID=UPI00313896AA